MKAAIRTAAIPVRSKESPRPQGGAAKKKRSPFPPEWPVKRVDELFKTQLGKMLSEKARGGDEPQLYLRNKNVQWGNIDVVDVLRMDFNEREKAKFKLVPGDLLICEGGVVGRAALWKGEIAECYYQKALHRLRPLNSSITNEFMLYWLRFAFEIQNFYGISGASSTIAHLPAAQLGALEMPVPPLPEQKKIAHILSTVQRAIAEQERIIQTTTELKKALMHKLFTEGLRNESQKQTEIGVVPKSWEVVPLEAKAVSFQYGTSVKCGYKVEGKPVLRIPNVVGGHVDPTDLKFGKPKSNELGKLTLQPGDLLFVRTNGVKENAGRCSKFNGELEDCYFASYLIRVRFDPKIMNADFVSEFSRTEVGTSMLSGRSVRTADGKFNINSGTLKTLLVPVPAIEEQIEIAKTFRLIDRKAASSQSKKANLQDLFRALLHELMTAKTRINCLK